MPADLSLVASTLQRELAARYNATVVDPSHIGVQVARGLLSSAARGARGLRAADR